MKMLKNSHIYAAITVVLWSLAYVFTRLALQYFSPLSLGFLRYFAASCVLVIILLFTKTRLPNRKTIATLILSGACGFFLYMIAFNLGSRTVTAATSCTVIATVPLITTLLARIIYREKLSVIQYTSGIISFIGVVILTVMNMRITLNGDLFLIVAAAVFLSVYNLLQRRLTKTCSALQATGFSIFFGTLMLGLFAPGAVSELPSASAASIWYVVILGVFCGAVAYCSWTKALSLADNTASVTNYMFIEPFLTAVFGFIIAKEQLELPTIIGGAVMLTGMFLFYFGNSIIHYIKNKDKRIQ